MKISVYITSFNKIKYIEKSILSVLSQTLSPYELLVVDDASTDGSKDLIQSFANKYPTIIKPIYNKNNLGIAKSRNIALNNISGDVITYLDADDYFYPNKLENEYNQLIKFPDIDIVYSNFDYIDEAGKVLGPFASLHDKPAIGNIFINTFIRNYNIESGRNYIYEMFYKNCVFDVGLYDTKLQIWEDWDLRIRMSKQFKYGYCSTKHSVYRQLPNSLHTKEHEIHYTENIKIYNKNKNLMKDLRKEEITYIRNRIFSKIKNLFISIINKKSFFISIFYGLHFIYIFKTRKSISLAYKSVFKNG